MCTTINHLHALEKEIELRLNGYQTCVTVPDYVGPKKYADEFGTHIKHVYELKESDRTNASFEDICRSFEKAIECYQVPEQEVPKAQLLPENLLSVFTSEVQFDSITKKKRLCLALDKKIKDKHLLCLPPSTIQIAAEISAMEHVSGIRANLSKIVRNEVDSFEERHAIPEVIPSALQALLQSENIQLPPFEPQILDDAEYEILKDNNRPGNIEQRQFVCNALSTPDFTIKEGPAGSGKTTSILETIVKLVKKGKRILLVASTNVAVDNILERLKVHLDKACVLRYGDSDNDRISPDGKKFILGKNFSKTEAKALQSRIQNIPEGNRTAEQQFLLDNCEPKDNEMLYSIIQENVPIVAGTIFGAALAEMEKLHSKGQTEAPFDYMILDEASKTTVQEFLVPAVLCKHWIIVGDIKQLSPYVNDDDVAENLQICYPEDADKRNEYTVASDSLLTSSGKGFRQTVILVEKENEVDAYLPYLYRKYAKENDILFADADQQEDVEILPYATIIVGSLKAFNNHRDKLAPRITTVRPAQDKKSGRILHEEEMQEWVSIARYNREVLFDRYDENTPKEWHDEVSWRLIRIFEQRDNKVNADHSTLARLQEEIEKLIPASDKENCKKNLHIFEQIYLPSCMELLLKGYGEYKDLALFRGIPKEMLDQRRIQLSFQHRCHMDIAKIASDEFYDGKAMRSEHMNGKREWDYRRFGKKHNHWENIKGRCDHKNRNKAEQKWIKNELEKFREFAKAKPNKKEKWSVAVLSFYKEQAEELKNICQRVFKDCSKFVTYSAGSVDSFQGHEADLVFLSYSNQCPTCFIGAPNRLNVAITRARYMMVYVGNWRAMSKGQGALGRIVQKLKNVTHNL